MPLYTFSGTPLAALVANLEHLFANAELFPYTASTYDKFQRFFAENTLWAAYLANASQVESTRKEWDMVLASVPLANIITATSSAAHPVFATRTKLSARHPVKVPAALLLSISAFISEVDNNDTLHATKLPVAAPLMFDQTRPMVDDATVGELACMLRRSNLVTPTNDPRFEMIALQPDFIDAADLMLFSLNIGTTIESNKCAVGMDTAGVQWYGMPLAVASDAATNVVNHLCTREAQLGNSRIF